MIKTIQDFNIVLFNVGMTQEKIVLIFHLIQFYFLSLYLSIYSSLLSDKYE